MLPVALIFDREPTLLYVFRREAVVSQYVFQRLREFQPATCSGHVSQAVLDK
jgi:hypothetical protein